MLFDFPFSRDGRKVILNLKVESTAISLDDSEVYAFDLEGRFLTAWQGDRTYLRTLDNRLIKKSRDPLGQSPWKLIEECRGSEKLHVLESAYALISRLAADLSTRRLSSQESSQPSLSQRGTILARLKKIVGWNLERLENQREQFNRVYKPITILPPDQYQALVLQATEGCHWNRCTFCHFYDQTHFHIKSLEEFQNHIQQAKLFFGDSIRLRRSIFLADANALVIPQPQLVEFFAIMKEEFTWRGEDRTAVPLEHGSAVFQGIYSFLDSFTGERKSVADFKDLQRLHLRRVYLGVETGCDELLQWMNKSAHPEQVLDVVANLKSAGIQVGIILLVGVGGDRYEQTHVSQTLKLVNSLSLGHGDLIYLSPLKTTEDDLYSRKMTEQGINSLSGEKIQNQLTEIRMGIQRKDSHSPQVALYDIREFVY